MGHALLPYIVQAAITAAQCLERIEAMSPTSAQYSLASGGAR